MIVADWLLYPLAALGAVVWVFCCLAVVWMGVEEARAWLLERRVLASSRVGERAA